MTEWSDYGRILCLRAGSKAPPPTGLTGRSPTGVYPSADEIAAHVAAGGNVGLVLDRRLIVVDVDAHRPGVAAAVARFFDRYLLPSTLRVGSRLNEAGGLLRGGHYYFRLPPDFDWAAIRLRSELPGQVGEVIYWAHRYVVIPSSVVADRVYRAWWQGVVVESAGLPPVDDLPIIPAKLLAALSGSVGSPVLEKLVADTSSGVPQVDEPASTPAGVVDDFGDACLDLYFMRRGNRDARGFRAATAAGNMVQIGARDLEWADRQVARIRRLLRRANADDSTVVKVAGQVRAGQNTPIPAAILARPASASSVVQPNFWDATAELRRCHTRSILAGIAPAAGLLIEQTILGSSIDHRVRLQAWRKSGVADPAGTPEYLLGPISIYVLSVGDPGTGKSLTFNSRIAALRDHLGYLDETNLAAPYPLLNSCLGDTPYYPVDELRVELARAVPNDLAPPTFQGITTLFARHLPVKGRKGRIRAVCQPRGLIYYDEAELLFEKISREYALLRGIKSAFYGSGLSNAVMTEAACFKILAETYTLSLLASLQWEQVSAVLATRGSGFYERLIFCEHGLQVDEHRRLLTVIEADPTRFPIFFNPDLKDAAWQPVPIDDAAHPRGGVSTDARVVLHPDIYAELDDFSWWIRGENPEKTANSPHLVDSWRALYPLGEPPIWSMSHMDTKLQRLAVLLAYQHGVKMVDNRVEVSPKFFDLAKRQMAMSAAVEANILLDVTRRGRKKRKVEADRQQELGEARELGAQSAQEPIPDRAVRYVADAGGEMRWSDFANRHRKTLRAPTRDRLEKLVETIPDLKLDAQSVRPRMIRVVPKSTKRKKDNNNE